MLTDSRLVFHRSRYWRCYFYCLLLIGYFSSPIKSQIVLDPSFGVNGVVLKPDFYGCVGCDFKKSASDELFFLDGCNIHKFQINGSVSSDFGTNGVLSIPLCGSTFINSIFLQNDGKIVFVDGFKIYRFLPNGNPDNLFGDNGVVQMPTDPVLINAVYPTCIAVQNDGKILLGGGVWSGYTYLGVARLDETGKVDSTFGTNGIVKFTYDFGPLLFSNSAKILLQPDGKILCRVGVHNDTETKEKLGLLRLNPDGSLDNTFGENGIDNILQFDESCIDFKLTANNDIIVLYKSGGKVKVFKTDPDGILDQSFGLNGFVTINFSGTWEISSLAIQNDHKILLTGSKKSAFSEYQGALIFRLTPEGALDESFAPEGRDILNAGGFRQGSYIVPLSNQFLLINGNGVTDSSSNNLNALVIAKIKTEAAMVLVNPKLAIASSQLNPGQKQTIHCTDFSPGGGIDLYITNPLGVLQKLGISADAAGKQVFDYADTNLPGKYTVKAKDVKTGRITIAKTFNVLAVPFPEDYLQIVFPTEKDTFYTQGTALPPISVLYTDKAFIAGNTYPLSGAYRLYNYKIEYSFNNLSWLSGGQQSGKHLVNSPLTLQYVIQNPLPLIQEGTCRVRVTDLYNPARYKISNSFIIKKQDAGLKADFKWDYSFSSTPAEPPVGVVADGVGRMYIKVYQPGKNINSVEVALSDGAGNVSPRYLGKVMSAQVINAYSNEANLATAVLATGSQQDNTGSIWFWYVAPDDFVTQPTEEKTNEREVNVTITATYLDGTSGKILKKIKIIRPPLILAHGLNSSPETWKDLKTSSSLLLQSDPIFAIRPHIITLQNTAAFLTNAKILTYDFIGLENSIPNIISSARKAGYACNQVDYICHSMGGSIMRYCMSPQINGTGNAIYNDFYGNRTYGKGFVHKVITLNTPHDGSIFADLLFRYRNDDIVKQVSSFANLFKNGSPAPAVRNLQIDPNGEHEGGVNFAATPSGSHFHKIAGLIDCDNYNESYPYSSIWWALYDAFQSENGTGLFDDDVYVPDCDHRLDMLSTINYEPEFVNANDLIVSAKSQLAGDNNFMTGDSRSVFGGLAHSDFLGPAITNTPLVADRLLFLLNQDIESPFFAQLPATNGFTPHPEGSSVSERPSRGRPGISTRSNDKFKVTSPLIGQNLVVDKPFQLRISFLDTTGFQKINILFQDEIYTSVTPSPSLIFDLQVNGNFIEAQDLILVAYYKNNNGDIEKFVEKISVNVITDDAIVRFMVMPKVNYVEIQQDFRPTYTATFQSFIGELGKSSLLTATIEDSSILQYEPAGNTFMATDTGSTYVVLNYKGKTDTIFFVVYNLLDSTTSVDNEVPFQAKGKEGFDFQVFPNPSNGDFNISIASEEDDVFQLNIYDALGRLVSKPSILGKNIANKGVFSISVDHMPAGIYHCHLVNKKYTASKTILVH